jgi:hypothetical protein
MPMAAPFYAVADSPDRAGLIVEMAPRTDAFCAKSNDLESAQAAF